VFNTQAGAKYRYDLLWAVVIGVVGIVVYAEMCGRIAAIAKRSVFGAVRQRLGFSPALITLIASQILNLATLAAEIGGAAIVLNLALNAGYPLFLVAAVVALVAIVWMLPLDRLENIFGYGGLMLLVYVVAGVHFDPNWGDLARGFVPTWRSESLYAYFVVGIIAAALMPYEVYFYSSGALEDKWDEKDLPTNKANAFLGFGLGAILSIALIVVSAEVIAPQGIEPEHLGTVALGPQQAFGQAGLFLALGGMLCAVGGAAIDASMSAAYNMAQFAGWEWGKNKAPRLAPRFSITWIAFFLVALIIDSTGVDPVQLTEYSVVFSVVALPFTYLPVLLTARDRTFMGQHANGLLSNVIGWFYFALILVLAVAAVPLLLATNGGGG
jgi:Mn2+/Fe2+ NRAMP family transporter